MEKDAQNCKNWAVKKAGRKAAPPAEPATYRFTLETDAVCHYQHNYFLFKKEIIMKKLIFVFSLLILVSAIFIADVNAQNCPPNYSYSDITRNYIMPGSGAVFTTRIRFCYTCTIGPIGSNITNITINVQQSIGINYDDLLGLDGDWSDDFRDWLRHQILDSYADNCTIGPCPHEAVQVVIDFPVCYYLENNPKYVEVEPGILELKPHYTWYSCDSDAYCHEVNQVCRDMENGGQITVIHSTGTLRDMDCEYDTEVPPIGESELTEWNTPCYHMWKCGNQ
jgi:hypothetical protein